MTELKCTVDNCTYNKEQLCSRGDILVGGKNATRQSDTCCESFAEKKGDSYTNAACCGDKRINIDCQAVKCVYNSDYKCTAAHVDVTGCSACDCKETSCATFKER